MSISNHVLGLQHIGVPTNDIEKSIKFYDGLGFKVEYSTVNPISNEKVSFMKMDNLIIEVYETKDVQFKTGAIDHIALNVTDISLVREYIKVKGYKILNKDIEFLPFWENGVKFFTIEGPNKEIVEFCEYL